MQKQHIIKKQVFRNKFRKFFGKEYFILKRKLKWIFDKEKYAVVDEKIRFNNCLIQHKSFLLRPLKDVERYVTENKHLPNVSSTKEIEEKGQGIGQLQIVQMEKIEEAFLYIIKLKKEVDSLRNQNQELKKLIEKK